MDINSLLKNIGVIGEEISSLRYNIMEDKRNLEEKDKQLQMLFELLKQQKVLFDKGTEIKLITADTDEIYYSVDGKEYIYKITG